MNVGDLMWVEFDSSGDASLSFEGVSASSQFRLLVQSTAQQSSSSSFTVGDIGVEKALGLEDPVLDEAPIANEDPGTRFHERMREEEVNLAARLAENRVNPAPLSLAKALATPAISKNLSEGDRDTFRVLSSLSSTTQYATVSATIRCLKGEVAVYVDDRMTNSSDLTDDNITTLCNQYADNLQTEKAIFGSYPDINSDGVVVALLTPAVNQLGASGGGIVTGFFYAGDLFQQSGSVPVSNQREIVFLMVPDPTGRYGTAISNAFAMSNLLPAVFPHELQHMISYYQHVFVAGGSAEENWLNEALSHFTEDLVGYGQENPSRYDLFLRSLPSISLAASGSPDIYERGASYLFLRFLYEQAADKGAFLNALLQTNKTGVDNLEAAFNGGSADFDQFEEFMKRWGVALALTDTGLTSDSRFIYADRTYNESTGHWQGACLSCDAEDGRGTVLTGPITTTFVGTTTNLSVVGTGTRIIDVERIPSSLNITSQSSGGGLQGVLIRTQ